MLFSYILYYNLFGLSSKVIVPPGLGNNCAQVPLYRGDEWRGDTPRAPRAFAAQRRRLSQVDSLLQAWYTYYRMLLDMVSQLS